MIKVGIIGAAGYTAGELLRILIHHPQVALAYAQSGSNHGRPLHSVHKDLLGDTDLIFAQEPHFEVDVIFLCSGHGKSRAFLDNYKVPDTVKIIDLGNDFRLNADKEYAGRNFLYALPELNKDKIQTAQNIANPGCFATCIQLALYPLAAQGLLQDEVHVSATTGSTGAGQKPTNTSHFSWRSSNFSSYKMFTHQHLAEITESLQKLQKGFNQFINFVPYRGTFTRGILATVYTKTNKSIEELQALYQDYYKEAVFTHTSDTPIDLKQVVNTNKALLYIEKHHDKVVITSIIDNLLKGASGQAVENMNLMFGLPAHTGLGLKSVGF